MSALLDIKDELERAYEQYQLAQFIDSTARMRKEQKYWSARISNLKKKIAEMEGDI